MTWSEVLFKQTQATPPTLVCTNNQSLLLSSIPILLDPFSQVNKRPLSALCTGLQNCLYIFNPEAPSNFVLQIMKINMVYAAVVFWHELSWATIFDLLQCLKSVSNKWNSGQRTLHHRQCKLVENIGEENGCSILAEHLLHAEGLWFNLWHIQVGHEDTAVLNPG